jgi:DeoR/GlpR family transcriptional regulator of sugar metabolism
MFAPERHNSIRKIVREHRRLSFAQLQEMMKVSPATLRRDLTDLEKSGDILRVHGGVLDPSYVRSEISLDERTLRHGAAKKAIAAQAAALIPTYASVFVDAGSTCLEAGKILLARKDVRVITHSVALTAISLHGQAEFLCIGGELRRVSGALIGGNALGALDTIKVDYALLGTSGMDHDGCSTTELTEAELKTKILQRSKNSILLADSSKWLQPSTIRFSGWTNFGAWVTNEDVSLKDKRYLSSKGVTIHIAPGLPSH